MSVFEPTAEQKIQLKKIEAGLEDFRLKFELCNYTYDREGFFGLMENFWVFISNFQDEKILSLFEHTEYFSKHKEYFSSLENYYVRTTESVESISILTKTIGGNNSFLKAFNAKMARETYLQTGKELKDVDFSKVKTLVMVGCGPMPETILYLYENTNIENIIGLDNNQEAIFMAGELIRAQGIERIRFLHQDAVHYDYKDADLIYVANFIKPKKETFDKIAKTAKNNVQIVTRTPVLFGKMLYEDTLASLNPRLTVIKEGEVSKYFSFKHLLLKKLDI